MSKVVEWSDLPEELLDVTANGLFSKVELLRFRSICKNWRSAVANKRLLKHRNRSRRRILTPYDNRRCSLSPAAFYRVVLSSCPDKGWLIKTQDVSVFSEKQRLLSPLSRLSVDSSVQSLDLLKFTATEIHQSYDVDHYLYNSIKMSYKFPRVVLVENLVFIVNNNKEIWWCNSSKSDNLWARIMDEEVEKFSDILLYNGHVYALDLKGAIWWISLSELNIYQFGPSTPMDYYDIDDCKDKRLVDFCGDLCIVHRFCKKFWVKQVNIERTVGFKVYKMDEELVEWVQVKSLGDQAFVMATDSCLSVLATEYYGCLENSIYFTDEEKENNVKVFKLGDGSITDMVDPASQSCFQMLNPPPFI